MKKTVLIFILLTSFIFADSIGTYESSLYIENGGTYFENKFGMKNLFIEYETGMNNNGKNLTVLLRNNNLLQIDDSFYYSINYNGEYYTDFTKNENSKASINGEVKAAKFINKDLFLNIFIYSAYSKYNNIPLSENVDLYPKMQLRFPETILDINMDGGIKFFTNSRRKDYSVSLGVMKKTILGISLEMGSYYMKTNNNINGNLIIELPDVYNESLYKSYAYVSKEISLEQSEINIYSKLENIFYIDAKATENYLYFGVSDEIEINNIVDLIKIEGESECFFKEYFGKIAFIKNF